ncbi:MAG: metalloregulator ArsR/SmtB family transcription factor [Gemmatimonadaceae bacterium]
MTLPASLAHLSTLADSTRSRLLLVLERQELTVGELCAIVQLPQSSVSRHLKVLGDEGWVISRADGTSRYYRVGEMPDEWTRRLWCVVRDSVSSSAAAEQDRQREVSVLAGRRARSREFFAAVGQEWLSLRVELFGTGVDLSLAFALLDRDAVVGDLGCGTGHFSARLAPHVRRVVAVDASAEMLHAARERLAHHTNVELHLGELEQLPIPDASLDLATLSLVLHYVATPARAIAEAYRVLRPGGRLVIMDMMPHERDDLQQRMGHLWRGFAADDVVGWLVQAGFTDARYAPLAADETARGPVLFTAGGRRPASAFPIARSPHVTQNGTLISRTPRS